MSIDRDEQRENRRKDPSCNDSVSLPGDRPLPSRKTADCDVPLEPAEEDQFDTPIPCPDPEPPLELIPDPLPLANEAYTATCPLPGSKPGPNGVPVTIDAGIFTDSFDFQTVPGINANQLSFIAGLSEAQRETLVDSGTTVATIAAITHLDTAQATFIFTQIADRKSLLNAAAKSAAEAGLSCFFLNLPQTAYCVDAGFPEGAFTNSNVPPSQAANVLNPSTVNGGLYQSFDSQEAADAIALNEAISNLKCLYGNDAVEVTCEDLGFTEAVTTDPLNLPPISFDGRRRVGKATILANTIFSNSSKEDANSLAELLAQSQLVCFYINDELLLSCETLTPPKTGTKATDADVLIGKSGNPVFVPKGFLQSTIDTADANDQAEVLANSLLDCYWTNVEKCKSCEPVTVTDPDNPDGGPIYVSAQDPGPVCVKAGTIVSYVSQQDADDQAQALADAQLICSYCNPEVLPKCPADSWSGTVPVPPEEVDDTWSVTATRGIAAGIFCSIDPQDVVNVATSIANVPADTGNSTDCCYGNLEVTAECEPDADGLPVDPLLSSGSVIIAANTLVVCDSNAEAAGWSGTTQEYATELAQKLANAALVCIWSNDERTAECPNPEGTVFFDEDKATSTVAAGLFTSFRSKAEANAIAQTVAESQLNCIYCNPGGETGGSYACSCQVYDVDDPDNIYNPCKPCFLCPWEDPEPGMCIQCPVPCPCGLNFLGGAVMQPCSVLSAVSSAAASAIAHQIAFGMRICAPPDATGGGGPSTVLGNFGTSCDCTCEEGETLLNCPDIPGDTVFAGTQAEANNAAANLCDLLKVCGPAGGKGAPGNSGAQTNCSGNCYGYYS